MDATSAMNICVVDDDEAVRDSLLALFESYGISARGYASANAFLSDSKKPASGWILLDLHMPDMTGLELLETLRERGEAYKTIVITGRGDPGLKDNALRAGAQAVLDKPVDGDRLIEALTGISPFGNT